VQRIKFTACPYQLSPAYKDGPTASGPHAELRRLARVISEAVEPPLPSHHTRPEAKVQDELCKGEFSVLVKYFHGTSLRQLAKFRVEHLIEAADGEHKLLMRVFNERYGCFIHTGFVPSMDSAWRIPAKPGAVETSVSTNPASPVGAELESDDLVEGIKIHTLKSEATAILEPPLSIRRSSPVDFKVKAIRAALPKAFLAYAADEWEGLTEGARKFTQQRFLDALREHGDLEAITSIDLSSCALRDQEFALLCDCIESFVPSCTYLNLEDDTMLGRYPCTENAEPGVYACERLVKLLRDRPSLTVNVVGCQILSVKLTSKLHDQLTLRELPRLIWLHGQVVAAAWIDEYAVQPWRNLLKNHPGGQQAATDIILDAHAEFYQLCCVTSLVECTQTLVHDEIPIYEGSLD
jgi:hypothetical protein